MRKVVCWVFALMLAFVIGVGSFSIPVNSASAEESDKKIVILDKSFATNIDSLTQHGITESQVSNLTPISSSSYQKLEGKSFVPPMSGDNENKYIDASINVDGGVASLDATAFNLDEMKLSCWIRLDLKPGQITRGLTIELVSADGSDKITWGMTASELKALSTRSSLSSFDQKIFGSDVNNAIVGWVQLSLPIQAGVITGQLVRDNKFTFSKLNIKQTTANASEVALSIYNVEIVDEGAESEDRITSKINDYCNVLLKPSASVTRQGDEFYFGEIFPKFAATKEIYSCLFVGDENYLDGTHSADLKIRVDTGLSGNSLTYFAYGSYNFKLSSSNYNIAYGFFYNDKFVSALAENITVSDYGKGVWLEDIEDDFRVGEQKKITYTVHKAFKNATINFESTNSEILRIVEVNKSSKYIIVECVKAGNAGINILVEDSRLEGTDFEDTGLQNQDFKIKVLKADKNVDTTKVLLWIALGLLLSGLVYLAIKTIIDSKKVEIR